MLSPFNDRDAFWMARALSEAERGRGAVEPNPMVGALVVRDDQLLGVGYHQRFGGPHAEVNALRNVDAKGGTLYVTLEPCCHHGKTPPCSDLVISSQVARVVVAMNDPFPKVAGGGIEQLRRAGITVDVGCLGDRARRLNAPYLKRLLLGEPYVIAKWAMSLDGKTATSTGHSTWISSEASRARVHELRGRVDAILVGIGTAIADDPELTARPPGPRVALRIVLDRLARLPILGKLARSAREVPVLVATGPDASFDRVRALEGAGVEVVRFEDEVEIPIGLLLKELGRRSCSNLLVEGGSKVLGRFLDERRIDEVDVYIATILEGGTHRYSPIAGCGVTLMGDAPRLERQETSMIGNDLRVRGTFPMPWLDSLGDSA